MQRVNAPKGTKDILPADSYKWQHVEEIARGIFSDYGYAEIRTPHFEHSEVFMKGIGEGTDVVGKEMYTFGDKKNRSMTLRPEGTAGVCRALIESGALSGPLPVKACYMGSFFRYEQPQDGRQREFHQIGAEMFGTKSALSDAEMIIMLTRLFAALGIKQTALEVSSIGCATCRPVFKETLIKFLSEHEDNLCHDCKARMHQNPLRVLDCKNEGCGVIVKDAPSPLSCLCDECAEHFDALKAHLDATGTTYTINGHLVRGLDYYTRTVFELKHAGAGAAKTLAGGGRYDGLVKTLGGADVPGIGFALGVERLMLTLAAEGVAEDITPPRPLLYIAGADERGNGASLALATKLRDSGLFVLCTAGDKAVKAQLKQAQRENCVYCTVIGETEIESGNLTLRNMQTKEEHAMNINEIAQFLQQREQLDG